MDDIKALAIVAGVSFMGLAAMCVITAAAVSAVVLPIAIAVRWVIS